MRPELKERRALVLGGSGAVGRALVRGLADSGVRSSFTFRNAGELAEELSAETGARALRVDLAEAGAIEELTEELRAEDALPDLLLHAAVTTREDRLESLGDEDWDRAMTVNARAPFALCRALTPHWEERGGADVVLLGALDRTQSMPLPIHFAASQGALSAMTMALAKELGGRGVRVNMLALGILSEGFSRDVAPELVADFEKYSALRRVGSPEEAARAALWLALENTYVSGKVLAVNGGI